MAVEGALGVMLGRRILTIGSGTALAQVLTAASTPLLTRLYAPEAHAAWAVFLSTTAIFSGIATLRYELAVVLPPDRGKAASLVGAGFLAGLAWSVAASGILFFFGEALLEGDLQLAILSWSWLVPCSVLSAATYQLAAAWCTRQAAFSAYALGQFALPTSIMACQLLFAAIGRRDAWGLIGGTVTGQLLTAAGLGGYIWWRDLWTLRGAFARHNVAQAAASYRKYPFYMTPYTLVGLVRERLAYFLLGRFGASGAAGHYNLVARLINLPNTFIASAIRPVFFQHAAGNDTRTLEEPLRETIRTLGFCALMFWAPGVIHASWLIEIIFGPAWGPAAPFAVVLSVPAIPLLMGNWADRMMDVLGRQRLAFGLELVFSTAAIAGLLGGFWWFGDLLSAVAVQSALLTFYYVVWLVVLFRVAGYRVRRLGRNLVELGLVGIVALGACYALARLLPPVPAFLVSLALGSALAGSVAWKAGRRIRNYLVSADTPADSVNPSDRGNAVID